MNGWIPCLALIAGLLPSPSVLAAGATVSAEVSVSAAEASLYQLDVDLESQDGKRLKLASFSGSPLIISMFYASCDSACPLIVNNIKALERRMTQAERAGTRVLLVSFDPQWDEPQVLKRLVQTHRIDERRWTLARASADQVENLAAVLGVKYKQLDARTISHTSVISVISSSGAILRQTEQFPADAEAMGAALKKALTSRE